MRGSLLKNLDSLFPFDKRGDCAVPPERDGIRISCIINFYGRLDLLAGILHSLAQQTFSREWFEIVLVEDRGGTDEGRRLADSFSRQMNINYVPLDRNFGRMGYSRNFGLSRSRGRYVLFLDDDTVIMQEDFLKKLELLFEENRMTDAIVPHGRAAFSLVRDRYAFHDPFFMTSRCCAYRRSVLSELGGFMSDFVGQEDVEFVIRFLLSGKRSVNAPQLEYFHPPLLVPNLRKPQAVGNSFYGLKNRYPLAIWLLVILNCCRHAPLYLVPVRRFREMGRFGLGFLMGVVMSPFKRDGYRYG
jgi:glycosyltransferase involved in cell wall biosynthesis